jgi:hypothetical protein
MSAGVGRPGYIIATPDGTGRLTGTTPVFELNVLTSTLPDQLAARLSQPRSRRAVRSGGGASGMVAASRRFSGVLSDFLSLEPPIDGLI